MYWVYSCYIVLLQVTHTLTFWSNGFSVDNGPLRKGDTPEDKLFLKSVSKGSVSITFCVRSI